MDKKFSLSEEQIIVERKNLIQGVSKKVDKQSNQIVNGEGGGEGDGSDDGSNDPPA